MSNRLYCINRQRLNNILMYFNLPADRLKLKINVTPNFTMMVTGHDNIKSYLYKYKIIES